MCPSKIIQTLHTVFYKNHLGSNYSFHSSQQALHTLTWTVYSMLDELQLKQPNLDLDASENCNIQVSSQRFHQILILPLARTLTGSHRLIPRSFQCCLLCFMSLKGEPSSQSSSLELVLLKNLCVNGCNKAPQF